MKLFQPAGRKQAYLALGLLWTAIGWLQRVQVLGGNPYDYDDAYSAYLALRLLAGQEWPTHSLAASVAFANPPGMAYLQAFPLALWASPLAVSLFIMGLNLLAVPLVFRTGWRLFSPTTGVTAAVVLAASPWTVIFSRRPWAQGLLVLGSAAALALLLAAARRRSGLAAGGGALAAMLASQTHLLGYLVPLQTLAGGALLRRRLPGRALVVGLGLGVLVGLPYYGHLALTASRAAEVVRGRYWSQPLSLDPDSARHALRLVTGSGFVGGFGEAHNREGHRSPLQAPLAALWVVLVGLGVIRGIRGARPAERAVLAWFLLPVALLAAHRTPVFTHYLVPAAPAGALLAGLGASSLVRRLRRARPALAVLLLGSMVVWTVDLRAELALNRDRPSRNLEYLPLAHQLRIGREVARLAPSGAWVLSPNRAEHVSAIAGRPLPTTAAFEVGRFHPIPPEGHLYLLPIEGHPPELPIPGSAMVARVAVQEGLEAGLWVVEAPTAPPDGAVVRLANGMELLSYRAWTQDGQVLVEALWRARAKPEMEAHFSVFNHLLDGEGGLAGQADGFPWPSWTWSEGWLYLTRYAIADPGRRPLRLMTGMYRIDTGERVGIVGSAESWVLAATLDGP